MPETSARTFRIINGALGVLILAALLLLARDMVSLKFGAEGIPSKPLPAKTATDRGGIGSLKSYAPILEINPFGDPQQLVQLGSKVRQDSSPSGTLSNLTLTGTATGPGKSGFAVFEDRSRPDEGQKVFRLGDNVFDYGRLAEVGDSYVKIERDSARYTLNIPFEKITTSRHKHKKHSKKSSRGKQRTFVKKVGEREYVLDRRKVEQSLSDPEKLLTDARMLPNIRNGSHEGFVISEIIPGGLYDSLGLKNGDILLRINGLEISNPEVAIQAMSALRGMNSVDLDIIRGRGNISLNYQIQ